MTTFSPRRTILPFTAIVGQEKMKKALLLNAVNPRIGGVLIRGEKGTAKSTAVRALAELLPEIDVVKGCPFQCNPRDTREMCEHCAGKVAHGLPLEHTTRRVKVVDLPLGVTEDRLVGTIDIERAIKEGTKAIEPGILAAVNRGILYIDEVNLLDDHIADVLLDSAALGVNVVEREGISFSHPARFILIGTMNPEEGEIRPQLLDRFGLQVAVEALDDPEMRMEIVRNAEAFDIDPAGFSQGFEAAQDALRHMIIRARELLPGVSIPEEILRAIVNACVELGVKTHRAEIAVARTARTLAALDGRCEVTLADVREAMELALPHRMRRKPFEELRLDPDRLDSAMKNAEQQQEEREPSDRDPPSQQEEPPSPIPPEKGDEGKGQPPQKKESPARETVFGIGDPIDTRRVFPSRDRDREQRKRLNGRRIETYSSGKNGTPITSRMPTGTMDLALDATIRAAAPCQAARPRGALAVSIREDDIREKVRVGKVSASCVFLVDASGSMGAMKRMEAAKGAILSLLLDSYQQRDRIGMVAFRGDRAEVLLPLSHSVDLAKKSLADLPTGGKTPLVEGIWKAIEVLDREQRKNGEAVPVLVLISDGRANVSRGGDIRAEIRSAAQELRSRGVHTVIIDTEETGSAFLKMQLGYCREIAEESGGRYYSVSDLKAGILGDIARNEFARVFSSS
ncbi:MAG: von Willebrand factor type A domain protein [Methanoregulaceae archaeon PtaU1.Bin059]|nr:MAG: von Willebrand factor type A domain protein [Methanoregulaceae archaeon PtaB.Bin152]OPY43454.1 MAG: von Willebrand factor type A domain protein [Methanoregulaceae archaeon PtaU1.Bin059]